MQQNKHEITQGTIQMWIVGIVLVVVLFEIVAALFPSLTAAGTTLNSSGFPLGELFVSGGAVWYILALGLVILVIVSFLKKSK